jgi:Ca2+-binding EF-hand superfamily protein
MEEVKKGNPGLLKTALCKNILLHYDKNHDGHISLKEFKRIARDFELADENHVKELFDKIDANHDNKISSEGLK